MAGGEGCGVCLFNTVEEEFHKHDSPTAGLAETLLSTFKRSHKEDSSSNTKTPPVPDSMPSSRCGRDSEHRPESAGEDGLGSDSPVSGGSSAFSWKGPQAIAVFPSVKRGNDTKYTKYGGGHCEDLHEMS